VCVFNYRGYGCSGGVPHPDAVKADALAVARYLQATRPGGRLVLHGESIGGLSACHVARTLGPGQVRRARLRTTPTDLHRAATC